MDFSVAGVVHESEAQATFFPKRQRQPRRKERAKKGRQVNAGKSHNSTPLEGGCARELGHQLQQGKRLITLISSTCLNRLSLSHWRGEVFNAFCTITTQPCCLFPATFANFK